VKSKELKWVQGPEENEGCRMEGELEMGSSWLSRRRASETGSFTQNSFLLSQPTSSQEPGDFYQK
jgi:hypothetical protein